MKISIIVLWCCLPFTAGYSQTYPFKQYTANEGLSQNQVTCLAQDSLGYLWVGTKGGLNRFDGITFEKFGKEHGLLSSNIKKCLIDRKGRLCVLTGNGLSLFNGQRFRSFPVPTNNGFFDSFFLNDTSIWVSVVESIHRQKTKYYQFNGQAFVPVLQIGNALCDSIEIIGQSTTYGTIYKPIGAQNRLLAVKGEQSTVLYHQPSKSIRTISVSPWGDVLVADDDHLCKMTTKGNKHVASGAFNSVAQIYWLNNDSFLVGNAFDSINVIGPQKHETIKWQNEQTTCLLADRENVLWIGTEYGLYRLMNRAFLNFSEKDGLNKYIWTILEDDTGDLWMASFGYGLQRYDGRKFHNINIGQGKLFDGKQYYMGGTKLQNGSLLFTTSMGVMGFSNNRFYESPLPQGGASLFTYQNPTTGQILVSSVRGLFVQNRDQWLRFTDSEGLVGNVLGIATDSHGNYWLAGRRLYRFNGQQLEPHAVGNPHFESTAAIEVDASDNVWVGGNDGLFVYDGKTTKPVFNNNHNTAVGFICKMDDHHFLVGRNNDIVVIDTKKFENGDSLFFCSYGRSAGFLGNECGQNGCLRDSKGRYWVASSNMVTCFDPQQIVKNQHPPHLLLKDIEIQADNATWQPLDAKPLNQQSLKLDHRQQNIRFHFTAISMVNPERILFKYRLVGHENSWSEPTADRKATFTNLSPGRYTFELMAANADGIWTTLPTTFSIHIKPAIWQTKLFKALVVALLFVLIVWGTMAVQRIRDRKKEEREKLMREYSRLQMATILKQFDPHFTFNAISSIGSLIVMKNNDEAFQQLLKLSSLLRIALTDHDTLTKTLEKEIEFVRNYCDIQKSRFGHRFDYNINIDHLVDTSQQVPKMMIQTFVENALKHGIEPKQEGGHVRINIEKKEHGTTISIADNGIGRQAAAELSTPGTRKGVKFTQKLFALLNQYNDKKITFETIDLYSTNGPSNGTLIEIKIPDGFKFN